MLLAPHRLSVVPVDRRIVMIGTCKSPFTPARSAEGLVCSSVCRFCWKSWRRDQGSSHPARPKASSRLVSVQEDRRQNEGQRKQNEKTFLTVQIEGQKNNTNDKRSTEKHNHFCSHWFLSDECYWRRRAVCLLLRTEQQYLFSSTWYVSGVWGLCY